MSKKGYISLYRGWYQDIRQIIFPSREQYNYIDTIAIIEIVSMKLKKTKLDF